MMVGFAVIVGIAVASNSFEKIFTFTSLLGFLTGFAISSFSMVSNDIYDIEVDRVNQPARPLPSGKIKGKPAWAFAVFFLIAGLMASLALGPLNLGIAAIFALVGWYYNYHGKKLGLPGNSLVALSLAIPYIFGSVALSDYSVNLAYLLALTSFLAGLGREVLKGIADVAGDKLRNIKTVAIVHGTKIARRLVSLLFISAVISSTFPVLANLLGHALYVYLGLVAIPDLVFVYLAVRTIRMPADSESLKLKSLALLGMLLGLLAYLISGLAV